MSNAELRAVLRPHGTVAVPCSQCHWFKDCGGTERNTPLFDCFQACVHKCNGCDLACPRSQAFVQCLNEIGGLSFDNASQITQRPLTLPCYVPVVNHRYCRHESLDWPCVALDTYDLFRMVSGKYTAVANSAEAIRQLFNLSPATQIILRGTAKDRPLEEFWDYRRRDAAAEQLAKLEVIFAVGPNFSHFLDVPRTDNLFNRKRQLICLDEFEKAGIMPVPHLSAVMPGDWDFWFRYLVDHATVRMLAAEFQTGNRSRSEGLRVVDHLTTLQQRVGRQLHPIVIGGQQFTEAFAARFRSFTLLDSRPFMTALHRHAFVPKTRKWSSSPTFPFMGIDSLVYENIKGYSAWIERRAKIAKVMATVTDRRAI